MTEFKCGIEIHQQLDCGKLFCECPGILRSDEPLFEVRRSLHAVAGEAGEIDLAAIHEITREREFVYQAYDSTCLVELDQEPPHIINRQALKTVIEIALFLNCEIVPITQIMRKTVVNGSNTSGFQRTVLIARNGYIESRQGKVRINSVMLEEDSAREVGKEGNNVKFRLDRLGIPLVEIATEPDIKTPEQAKEVALFIGDVLRSCKVKRGIGTIRQDINISSSGHARVEIKGFQDVKLFVDTINNEVRRQKAMIGLHEELKKRKAHVDMEISDLTKLFENTECKLIKNNILLGGVVIGAKLEGFRGVLKSELYQNKRFGTELADYAKSQGVHGIIHSDEELTKYNISENEREIINDKLGIKENDAFILIAERDKKARRALTKALERAGDQVKHESIAEVRNALSDASTMFLRPMPGSARMYPETDLELLRINRVLLNEVKNGMPKLRSEFRGEMKEKGLSEEMVKLLSNGDKVEEFETLLKIVNDPNFIAKVLFLFPKEIEKHEKIRDISEVLTLDNIESIVEAVSRKKIEKQDVKHVMELVVKGKSVEEAVKIERIDETALEGEVMRIVREKPGLSQSGYMGLIMQRFKGKIVGNDAKRILEKVLKK